MLAFSGVCTPRATSPVVVTSQAVASRLVPKVLMCRFPA